MMEDLGLLNRLQVLEQRLTDPLTHMHVDGLLVSQPVSTFSGFVYMFITMVCALARWYCCWGGEVIYLISLFYGARLLYVTLY